MLHRRQATVQKPDGVGKTAFSFDRVYGGSGAPFEDLYPISVAPLVADLFEGYSATAFAYGARLLSTRPCIVNGYVSKPLTQVVIV